MQHWKLSSQQRVGVIGLSGLGHMAVKLAAASSPASSPRRLGREAREKYSSLRHVGQPAAGLPASHRGPVAATAAAAVPGAARIHARKHLELGRGRRHRRRRPSGWCGFEPDDLVAVITTRPRRGTLAGIAGQDLERVVRSLAPHDIERAWLPAPGFALGPSTWLLRGRNRLVVRLDGAPLPPDCANPGDGIPDRP
jgi:hypothetical protein